jgi:non-specific protein-tyrosine kinase
VDLDLRQLLQIARRRWWIVALMMVVAGTAAYASASRETPMYSASATMLVSPGQAYSGAIDYNSLLVTERLAETYPQLITNADMYQRVADALGMEVIPGVISASAIEGSQLVLVTVTDTDPERAALVANTVVSEFQAYTEERAQQRADTARGMLDTQIEASDKRLDEIDARLDELDTAANRNDPAAQREIEALTQEQASLSGAKVDLNTNSVTIGAQTVAASPSVEPAGSALVPEEPFSPRPRRSALLGVFVGLLLGVGLVALLEFLDNTVKPEQNLQELTGAPLLATVPALNRIAPGGGQVYVMSQPNSGAAEAQRLLRTNLEFASASGEIDAVTITSPGPGEGKSTTAANLGVVMAQAGLRTVVIDADLRKPTQARIFGVASETGLTTLLTHPEQSWHDVAKKVALPGLELIPCGPLPPNPSDLLSSSRFESLLASITAETDIVIIDSPPVLVASDALSIAAHTDGVVMVCHSHQTRTDALRHAADSVRQGGIRLIGLVLNRQKGQQGASYYGEYYGAAVTSGD